MILCLETSEKLCSVALCESGRVLALFETAIERSHSGLITVLIQEALKAAKGEMGDIEAIALSSGPGSYTGLRVGAGTAKGLCMALDVPLLSVPTLEALACAIPEELVGPDDLVVPLMDARRMEVYGLVCNCEGEQLFQAQPVILTEYAFEDYLETHRLIALGSGAFKIRECPSARHPNWVIVENKVPSAALMATIACEKWAKKDVVDTATFEPEYLKPYQGLKLSQQKKGRV